MDVLDEATTPVLPARTIGGAWLDVADRILRAGIPATWDAKPTREIRTVTLEVAEPRPDDPQIARFADPERLAWMHANFTEFRRVRALGDAASYASRLFDYLRTGRDQIRWVIDRLAADPTRRDAVITTLEPTLDTSYVPCVSLLDFWIPDGRLELVVAAHSIDFGTKGYANLVELAELQHRVAHALEIPVGRLLMSVKSAHIYEPELEPMRTVVAASRRAAVR
ncbi:thymidylate synthase [Amnibacterium sp.]|uniref:thymidylate synthase n=1 Tax=Amnibacterium sp. TaxID=1872496 RepID=UPI003F7C71FE